MKTSNPSPRMVETILTMPIINPDTNHPSRTFVLAGKIDLIDERGYIIDWKTVADTERHALQQLIGAQMNLYALLALHNGIAVRGMKWYLIKRPTIKLKAKQTVEEYEEECRLWCLSPDYPERMVERFTPLDHGRLEYTRRWLWNTAEAIRTSHNMGFWSTNELACHQWNRRCEYADLCECRALSADLPDVLRLYVKTQINRELEGLSEIGGKRVLTHSALSAYGLCQQKYQWRYEEGLIPEAWELTEALDIGIDFHACREVHENQGLDVALEALRVSEEDVVPDPKVEERQAKKRAMLRAAAERWPVPERVAVAEGEQGELMQGDLMEKEMGDADPT